MSDVRAIDQPVQHRPAVATILYVLLGPLIWAAHLTIIYASQSVACALAAAPRSQVPLALDVVQLAIVAATVVSLAVIAVGHFLAGLKRRSASREDDLGGFLASTMRLLVVLSALGIAAAGTAALVLPTCPTLR